MRYSAYGVSERYELTATRHLNEGDEALFYITKLGMFCGPWEVNGRGERKPDHPAVKEWRPAGAFDIIIPLRRKADLGACSIQEVFDRLYFITNRREWTDHLQFSIISIRDEDYNTIKGALSSEGLLNLLGSLLSPRGGTCPL